jgi:hypothetical protein
MNGILNKPEARPQGFGPDNLFRAVVEFLSYRIGLDSALDLLTCLLEAL